MPSYRITRERAAHTAHVQEGRPFDVPAKSTLLMAAQAAGLDWPYGCRVGVCGRCRLKLLHGSVSALGDHAATLGADAVSDRYILACRSLLESDVLVLPPDQAAGHDDDVRGTITRVTRPVHEIAVLEIALETPFSNGYAAGQYARLSVPDAVPPRCFSFATACRGDARVEFHVRLFPEGRLAGWLTADDVTGAGVSVSQPLGEISLAEVSADDELLFVAGGTGLSPVLAMVEELAGWIHPRPRVKLLYAARDQAHLYAATRLRSLARRFEAGRFDFVPVLSREPGDSGWTGRRGHLFDHLGEVAPGEGASRRAFLCGPPGLVDATELALLKLGWPRAAIAADRFIPAFD